MLQYAETQKVWH